MFEKVQPKKMLSASFESDCDIPQGDLAQSRSTKGDEAAQAVPLRAIEWSDLTARLSAARDLRALLREDAKAKSGAAHQGFAEAAAQFFRANEEDERPVNLNALEARKTSSGKHQDVKRGGDHQTASPYDLSAGQIVTPRGEPGDAREE